MELFQHDASFFIKVNGDILMDSRMHASELDLARLGCGHLAHTPEAKVLIGGLGLGYTARQALDTVGRDAKVTVCELVPEVIDWNRQFLGPLAGHPLRDKRTHAHRGDIVEFLKTTTEKFDAILLDIDNGPQAMTDSGNSRLYNWKGVYLCLKRLTSRGCLAVWSVNRSARYEHELLKAGFQVKRYNSRAHTGNSSIKYIIWVAATDKNFLPPGGTGPIVTP